MTTEQTTTPAGRPWDWASVAVLILIALLIALTFRHYGSGFDAEVQDVYGRQIVSWYRTLGADRSALSYIDLYYYGGLFDMLAALANLVSPFGHWATRHLMEALFGLAGLVGTWRLARHLGGPLAGFLGLTLLALMPSYYGMMFINPKDIPFAALMVWAVLAMTRLVEAMPRPPLRLVAAFGLTAGLALGTRVGGVLLFAYLGLVLAAVTLTGASGVTGRLRLGIRLGLGVLLPSLAVAWAVMLVFWPWAQVAPLAHPLAAIAHFAGMHNDIDTLYFGREIGLHYHPASYLPVYILIKLPDLALLMLAAAPLAAITAIRRDPPTASRLPRLLPVLLAVLFPLAYVLLTRPELYDADRHFLFVLPPLAATLGLGTARLSERVGHRRWARAAMLAVFVVGSARQVAAMTDLHPYEYAFFNDMVGGTAGARGRFETEYWGASLAEATGDLDHYIATHRLTRSTPWRVAVCGHTAQMGDGAHPMLQPASNWARADFFVATTRHGCDRSLSGHLIGEVERDGVPFAVVKDLRRPARTKVAAPLPRHKATARHT